MASTYEGLNKAYKELTGVVNYDFETLSYASSQAQSEAEKNKLYHDVVWHIPGGRYLEVEPYKSKNSYVCSEAAKIAGVGFTYTGDNDMDNDTDFVDKNIYSYAYTHVGGKSINYETAYATAPATIEFVNKYTLKDRDIPVLTDETHNLSYWAKPNGDAAAKGDVFTATTTLTAVWVDKPVIED